MKAFLFLYVLLLHANLTAQQTSKVQRFRIFGVPESITTENPGISQGINKELLNARSAKDAFKIINNQLKKYYNTKVRVREQLSETVQYYTYYVGAFREQKSIITDIKATRDLSDNTIYRRYQLKTLFSDTLAIIDTLSVNIYPADFNYRIDGYYIINSESGSKIILPHADNQLLLYGGLFPKDAGASFSWKLFNNKEPDKPISTFHITLLSRLEKQELFDLYMLLKEDSNLQPMELLRQMQSFAIREFGKLSLQSITTWLHKADIQ